MSSSSYFWSKSFCTEPCTTVNNTDFYFLLTLAGFGCVIGIAGLVVVSKSVAESQKILVSSISGPLGLSHNAFLIIGCGLVSVGLTKKNIKLLWTSIAFISVNALLCIAFYLSRILQNENVPSKVALMLFITCVNFMVILLAWQFILSIQMRKRDRAYSAFNEN